MGETERDRDRETETDREKERGDERVRQPLRKKGSRQTELKENLTQTDT